MQLERSQYEGVSLYRGFNTLPVVAHCLLPPRFDFSDDGESIAGRRSRKNGAITAFFLSEVAFFGNCHCLGRGPVFGRFNDFWFLGVFGQRACSHRNVLVCRAQSAVSFLVSAT